MARIFFPGCRIKAAHPEACAWLEQTALERGWVDRVTGCCKANYQDLTSDDTAVIICTNCLGLIGEAGRQGNLKTIWEIIDADSDFPLPDYASAQVALQDCGRVWESPAIHQAVRSLLAKMNLNIVELPDAREKSTYCGFTFLGAPSPEALDLAPHLVEHQQQRGAYPGVPQDQRQSIIDDHCAHIEQQDVACYCVPCETGLTAGRKRVLYLLELIKGMDL